MKRTKINKEDILMQGKANRVRVAILYSVRGKLKLTQEKLIWQSYVLEMGKKELILELDQIADVTIKNPFYLNISTKDGKLHRFIIPRGPGGARKGTHPQDWQKILLEMSSATGSIEEADENDPLIGNVCMNCGASFSENVKFCSNCGTIVPHTNEAISTTFPKTTSSPPNVNNNVVKKIRKPVPSKKKSSDSFKGEGLANRLKSGRQITNSNIMTGKFWLSDGTLTWQPESARQADRKLRINIEDIQEVWTENPWYLSVLLKDSMQYHFFIPRGAEKSNTSWQKLLNEAIEANREEAETTQQNEVFKTELVCPNCGSALEEDSAFCVSCGTAVKERQTTDLSNQPQNSDLASQSVGKQNARIYGKENKNSEKTITHELAGEQKNSSGDSSQNQEFRDITIKTINEELNKKHTRQNPVRCSKCNAELEEDSVFCVSCGTPVKVQNTVWQTSSAPPQSQSSESNSVSQSASVQNRNEGSSESVGELEAQQADAPFEEKFPLLTKVWTSSANQEEKNSQKVHTHNLRYCLNCGNELSDEAELCPKCGLRVRAAANASSVAAANKEKRWNQGLDNIQQEISRINSTQNVQQDNKPNLQKSAHKITYASLSNPEKIRCSHCSALLEPDDAFCSICGTPVRQEQKTEVRQVPQNQKMCPSCGTALDENAEFCHNCGTSLKVQTQHTCKTCGKSVAADMEFCPYCGTPVNKKKCINCEKLLEEDMEFCPYCGTLQNNNKCLKCGRELAEDMSFCPYCGEVRQQKN